MNRNAFTLIEVLVSVAILAVVATGLFQISMNSKNNFTFLEQKARFDRLSSIPVMHNDEKYHHKEKTLFDFLRADYEIKKDEVRQFLKKEKISYEEEEYAKFAPFAESGNETDQNSLFAEDEGDENRPSSQAADITLIFDKITVSNKHNATYVYKIKIQ